MKTNINEALAKNEGRVSSTPKKEERKKVDDYLKGIADFEADRVELAKSSAKRAWQVAGGASVIAFLAVLAVLLLTPLKQVTPYVVRVNDADGTVTILEPLKDAEAISYGEVLDEYWSREFVYARNGYDWETIQDNFNLVNLMGNKTVVSTYATSIKSEKSPVKLFSDKRRIKIEIQDVAFLPTDSQDNILVQVRFTRDVILNNGETDPSYDVTHWNATITFDYLAEITTPDERVLNPLGYRATSYAEKRVFKQ